MEGLQYEYQSHPDYYGFCDSIAAEIGVLPDFEKLKQTDPKLYEALIAGPFNGAHYGLCGFGANEANARKFLEDVDAFLNVKLGNK